MFRPLSSDRVLRVLLAACAAAALALAAACGPDGEAAPPLDAEESFTEGFLVHRDGVTRVCEMLAESFPPQCGGASLRVDGLDLETIAGLETADGVTWSNEAFRLTGRLSGDLLTVREAPQPAAMPPPVPADSAGETVLEGFVVHRDGEMRLCEALALSYPPQCGSPFIVVQGVAPEALPARQQAEGVTWSDEVLRLTGQLSGGVLTVGQPPEVMSQAHESPPGDGAETVVEGFLLHRDGTTWLCQSLLESYPPQCGSPSVQVDNLALEDVAGLQSAEGVTWSDDPLRLTGRLANGILTVTAVGGDAPAPLPAEPALASGDSDATAATRNPDGPAASGASSSSSSDSAADAPTPPAGQQGNEEPDDVEGFLVHRDGVTLLCELLAESYPPQCGGSSVRVEGLDLESVAGLKTAEGVTWSDGVVRLTGRLRDGVLTIG